MKRVLLFLAAAALFAVSCNKEASYTRASEGGPVKFSADLKYHFDTRATATAFQDGDKIGIFAGTPISRSNVKGTIGSDGQSVVVESPINWQVGQTSPTTFAAYFPYNAGTTSPSVMVIDWSVAADQTNGADLDASDLRIANAVDVAVDSPVSFSFSHAFAKIAITAICNITGSSIQKIEILGTKRVGTVDLAAQTVTPSGDASAITAYRLNSSSPFEAIILPQTVAPQIKVTITGGSTYTYSMDGAAFAFEAGKVYNCAIAVNPGSSQQHAVTFSVGSITDWVTGINNGFSYTGDPDIVGANVWSIIGTINNSNWNVDFPMTKIEDGTEEFQGIWRCNISGFPYDHYGVHFKLRFGGKWKFEGGYEAGYPNGDGTLGDCLDFPLKGEQNQNGNIYINPVPFDGHDIQITFNANTWKISMCQAQ